MRASIRPVLVAALLTLSCGDDDRAARPFRAEHDRFARAIALSDDVGVLVREMKVRTARIQYLEAKIEVARKTPADIARLTKQVEVNARAKLDDLRHAFARPEDRRQVFLAMFPRRVRLAPDHDGTRQVWKIAADAHLDECIVAMFNRVHDPVGGDGAPTRPEKTKRRRQRGGWRRRFVQLAW